MTMPNRLHLLLLAVLLPFANANAAPFAYIVVGSPINALRVLDTQTNLDARTPLALPAPLGPVALSANGKLLYALSDRRVYSVETATNNVAAPIDVPEATGMALSPDGRRLYGAGVQQRFVVELATGKVTTLPQSGIITYAPEVIAAADGQVYWTQCAIGLICVLFSGDPESFAEKWSVSVGADRGPGIAAAPDGTRVYVSASSSPHFPWAIIKSISTETRQVMGSLDLGVYGLYPGRMAISPDGRQLYSLNGASPSVTVVDTATMTIVKNIPLDVGNVGTAGPQGGIAITPNGKTIYVTNGALGTVSVIDTGTLAVTLTIGGFGRADSSGNFMGPAERSEAVEYYNATLDHYFVTALYTEIYALDNGAVAGWSRTGQTFPVYGAQNRGGSPVCRYYIPPAYGDSHFYSASPAECAEVRAKFPTFVLEASDVFYIDLPDSITGSCPPGDAPVYRMWNKRADSNHRYTTSVAVRDSMLGKGYIPEGYGPDATSMCAP